MIFQQGVWSMGWFNAYRYRMGVDWPCTPDYSPVQSEPDWRVRLGILVASLAATGLLAALAIVLRG